LGLKIWAKAAQGSNPLHAVGEPHHCRCCPRPTAHPAPGCRATASISARKLSHGTRRSMASSGSPLADKASKRLLASKNPAAPSSPLRIKISRIRFAQVGRSSYFSRCPYATSAALINYCNQPGRASAGPDRKFAPRQDPPLIPVHSPQLPYLLRQDCCEFLRPFRHRGHKIHHGFNRNVRRVRSQHAAQDSHFLPRVCSRVIVRIAQCMGQEMMARPTHPAQIDLRFGDLACEFLERKTSCGKGSVLRRWKHESQSACPRARSSRNCQRSKAQHRNRQEEV